ncbi:MAG TPA: LLM class flavin-dependent oxidoreductase [Acidimicrobiia bacterium]|nr:LLM class flavin-dependent oxidoreductase [Acidimicrobiia bacterium]
MTGLDLDLLLLGRHEPDSLAALARTAADSGFDRVLYADERFFRDCWATLGYLAARVPEIGLGVCVTDPFVRHPALTAAAAATVDELSGGRFTLGLGAGVSGFAAMGIERTKPLVAMREAVALIRRLLRGDEPSVDGSVIAFHGAGLDFTSRRDVPVMIATNGPQMLELAGELADEVMVQGMASPIMARNVLERIARGAERAGRDPSTIRLTARLDVAISDEDPAAAKAAMRPGLVRHLATHHPRYASFALAEIEVPEAISRRVADTGYGHGASRELEDLLPTEWVDRFCLAGTESEVVGRLSALVEAGVDAVTIMPVDTGRPISEVVEQFGILRRGLSTE